MEQNRKGKKPTAPRAQTETAADIEVGLSTTGGVHFAVGDVDASHAKSKGQSDQVDLGVKGDLPGGVPRTVKRNLRVPRKDIRVRRGGIEFVSRGYANALNSDHESVVRALSRKYPWIDARRITVRGNKIFIGSEGGDAEAKIFENLCLVIKLNICKKDKH